MSSSKWIFTCVVFVFLFPAAGNGQVNDAGFWASATVEKKLSKRFTLEFEEEIRLYENYSEVGTLYSELMGSYKVNKFLSIAAGYRFTLKKRLDDSYSNRHRYLIDVNLKEKFGRFRTGVRFRYQAQYRDVYSREDGMVAQAHVRAKAMVKYDFGKRYFPFATGEMAVEVTRPEGWLFDAYRISAGVEYEWSKRTDIQLRYIFDREVQVKDPWTNYVMSVGWSHRF